MGSNDSSDRTRVIARLAHRKMPSRVRIQPPAVVVLNITWNTVRNLHSLSVKLSAVEPTLANTCTNSEERVLSEGTAWRCYHRGRGGVYGESLLIDSKAANWAGCLLISSSVW